MSKSLFILGLFTLATTPCLADEAITTPDASLCDVNMTGFAKLQNRDAILDLYRAGALEAGRLNADVAKEVVLPASAALCPAAVTKRCRTILDRSNTTGLANYVLCPPNLSEDERVELMGRAAKYWDEHAIY
jgi:hypothetical protein